nr:MAG TPA: hypothetical protein [Caudoviricetes sp.]
MLWNVNFSRNHAHHNRWAFLYLENGVEYENV